MNYAAICLVFLQVLVIIAGCFAVSQLLRAVEVVKRDNADLKRECGELGSEVARVTQEFSAMKWEHYESLRQHVLSVETVARSAKAQAESNEESWRNVNNKLASRDRADKKAQRETKETTEEEVTPELPMDSDLLPYINTLQQAQPPVVNGLPRGFGKSHKGGGY